MLDQLHQAEHQAPEWQAATEALILVAEHDRPTMMARVGIMRALNAGKPDPVLEPHRKHANVYTRINANRPEDAPRAACRRASKNLLTGTLGIPEGLPLLRSNICS